jgi:hypothetical protein
MTKALRPSTAGSAPIILKMYCTYLNIQTFKTWNCCRINCPKKDRVVVVSGGGGGCLEKGEADSSCMKAVVVAVLVVVVVLVVETYFFCIIFSLL